MKEIFEESENDSFRDELFTSKITSWKKDEFVSKGFEFLHAVNPSDAKRLLIDNLGNDYRDSTIVIMRNEYTDTIIPTLKKLCKVEITKEILSVTGFERVSEILNDIDNFMTSLMFKKQLKAFVLMDVSTVEKMQVLIRTIVINMHTFSKSIQSFILNTIIGFKIIDFINVHVTNKSITVNPDESDVLYHIWEGILDASARMNVKKSIELINAFCNILFQSDELVEKIWECFYSMKYRKENWDLDNFELVNISSKFSISQLFEIFEKRMKEMFQCPSGKELQEFIDRTASYYQNAFNRVNKYDKIRFALSEQEIIALVGYTNTEKVNWYVLPIPGWKTILLHFDDKEVVDIYLAFINESTSEIYQANIEDGSDELYYSVFMKYDKDAYIGI